MPTTTQECSYMLEFDNGQTELQPQKKLEMGDVFVL